MLRLLVVRHGARPFGPHDPEITDQGHAQAQQLADQLALLPNVRAVYSSPFIRALQTAAPLATRLGLKIRVDWQICEALATGWVFGDPWPHLLFNGQHELPHVPRALIDSEYTSSGPPPAYPEFEGSGDDLAARSQCLERHRSALAAIAAAELGSGGIVIVVGHGSTHNFLTEAACPGAQGRSWEDLTPPVPNCSVTTLLFDGNGHWLLDGQLGSSAYDAYVRATGQVNS